MELAKQPVTAVMDPWTVIDLGAWKVLFGFTAEHAALGGQSWMRSSPIVEVDEEIGRARTESGRIYRLGRRFQVESLRDEEAIAAASMLLGVGPLIAPEERPSAARWLAACKMARWLKVVPPVRSDPEAVISFLGTYAELYGALRQGHRRN